MRAFLFLPCLFLTQLLVAQSFTLGASLEPISATSTAFADVDGDNDLDVLIAGYDSSFIHIVKLYTNGGNGNFTEVQSTPFEALSAPALAFADVDGDNDQDVLITGYKRFTGAVATLYSNDGNGNFTAVTGTTFEGGQYGDVDFADVDGDNDLDLLIIGLGNMNTSISKLYSNDGNGNFTEVTGTPFEGVQYGAAAFADVDGDNDLDLLITGGGSGYIAKLYTNDGSGNFSLVTNTPFKGVWQGGVAFADIDGDTDQDVFIIGNETRGHSATLYTNDGNGNFTEVTGTSFQGGGFSAVAFSDVEGDGDQDVLISGRYPNMMGMGVAYTGLYTNDGNGAFTKVTGIPFVQTYAGSISFADIDGDTDEDILITGNNSANLYINGTASPSSIQDKVPVLPFHLSIDPSSEDQLRLYVSSAENNVISATIYDLHGRVLFEKQARLGLGSQTMVIPTHAFNPGHYVIRLEDGERAGTQKFRLY